MYLLSDELVFPDPKYADEDGLLAIGGDLSVQRLLLAYQYGIFPWFNEGEPIIWWSPDPRFILYPEKLKVSKSMRSLFRKVPFSVTFDKDFQQVISQCKTIKRKGQEGGGTWITQDVQQAYIELHKLGIAHSVEVWQKDELVGGLYGVSLGKCFFGESMFTKVSNASKYGFITLVQKLKSLNFTLVDCQIHTDHLESLGAEFMSRSDFMQVMLNNQKLPTLKGNWQSLLNSKSDSL